MIFLIPYLFVAGALLAAIITAFTLERRDVTGIIFALSVIISYIHFTRGLGPAYLALMAGMAVIAWIFLKFEMS